MKKTKFLVLAMMSTLTLVGCGGGNSSTDKLPSGGNEVDLKEDTGVETLRGCVANAREAYADKDLTSASLKSKTSGGLGLDVKASTIIGDIALKLDAKDLGLETEASVAKSDKGNVDAAVKASTTGGSVALSGSLPKELDLTAIMTGKPSEKPVEYVSFSGNVDLKGAKANAYLNENKAYVDYSGNEAVVGRVDTFLNGLYGQLKDSALGMVFSLLDDFEFFNEDKFIFSELYAKEDSKIFFDLGNPVVWPEMPEQSEEEKEAIDTVVNTIVEFAKEDLGLTFKTYSGKGFGFQFALSKEGIMTYINNNVDKEEFNTEAFDKYLKKLSLNAAVLFDSKALLQSVGFSLDVEAKLDEFPDVGEAAEMVKSLVKSFEATVSLKASESLEFKWNSGKVSFPSFDGYVEKQLPQPEEDGGTEDEGQGE